MTRYIFLEGSFIISNKGSCMDDETWEKAAKVVSRVIRRMKARNVCFVLNISFSIYLTLHIYPSKFSTNDL